MAKSTLYTGIAIANSMVGSSMIIFPINFIKHGMIENIFFVLLMSALMALTCRLFCQHIQSNQTEISQSIKRILGPAFFNTFCYISASTVFLVASVFFLLASSIFYDFFVDLIPSFAEDFNKKLFQAIILGLFAAPIFLKNLDLIFKMSPYAFGFLLLSTLIIIISFPFNFDNIDSGAFEMKEISLTNLLTVASMNGFAFICHPSISPIIKEHEDQKQNAKAVYIGYGITTAMYLTVGILGSLAIYKKRGDKSYDNVIDYFDGEWQSPCIGLLNFAYFVIIVPIFPFVGKSQFLEALPKFKERKNIHLESSALYAVLWIGLNLFFIFTETSPEVVISFLGAVMCYYITYFLPIYMTIRISSAFYSEYKADKNELEDSLIISDGNNEQAQDAKRSLLSEEDQKNQITANSKIHLTPLKKSIYIAILAYGGILMISEIVSMFL